MINYSEDVIVNSFGTQQITKRLINEITLVLFISLYVHDGRPVLWECFMTRCCVASSQTYHKEVNDHLFTCIHVIRVHVHVYVHVHTHILMQCVKSLFIAETIIVTLLE